MQNIIFDLDGTLWDSTKAVFKAWSYLLAHDNRVTEPVTEEQLQSVFGVKHDEIGNILFPYLSKEDQEDIIDSAYNQEIVSIKEMGGELYSNLENILIELSKKYSLYIVSNCQEGYVEAFYHYHKLNRYFKDFECSGNTGRDKAYNIKLVIDRNHLEDCIYVGDTQGDYNATKANNLPFIYAEYGFGHVDKPEYSISKIAEILEVINKIYH